jgi:hypothetical protein
MIRNLALTLALVLGISASAQAAQKNYLSLESGGSFSVRGASMVGGSPASIVTIRCEPKVCGSSFSAWFETNRVFPRGKLVYEGESLSLEDVRFIELHRMPGAIEVVLHVTRVNQTGVQNGIDAQF